jgi:hypothetical protein
LKKFLLVLTGLFVLLVGCVAVVGSSGSGDTPTDASAEAPTVSTSPAAAKKAAPPAPKADEAAQNIKVTECGVNDLSGTKFAEVNYTISNPTSKSSDYIFQVAVIDSTGASVSQASGFESNVLPGRPSQGQAMGNVSDSAVGPYTCEVSDVTRMSSN